MDCWVKPKICVLCILCCILFMYILTVECGCTKKPEKEDSLTIIIPEKGLPEGWKLLPSSAMPPNDKMPWWTENPMVFQKDKLDDIIKNRFPGAVSMSAAAYGKEGQVVVIFCLAYLSRKAAESDYMIFHKEQGGLLGFSKEHKDVLVYIGLDQDLSECQSFVQYFKSIVEESSNSNLQLLVEPRQESLTANVPQMTEADLIAFFQVWINLTADKVFPPDFWGPDLGKILVDMTGQGKFVPSITPDNFRLLKQALYRGLSFLNQLPQNEWAYMGQNVPFGDPKAPIFWYRLKNQETYRVIYTDLSVQDISSRPVIEKKRD